MPKDAFAVCRRLVRNEKGGKIIERSISVMVGKGSVGHNKRKFFAVNVDQDRTEKNITYIDKDIKRIYHELFDSALLKYNEKQIRNDRKIPDYYEKIRSSKQEKLFHEVIYQIGNKEDMNARDENGEMVKAILTEFLEDFQNRNPHLKVFSANLHMDEETPHLHIDFVPFTTGSKRGLETRVSLKQALAKQGFRGGSRSETEWNQWVQAEKEELSKVMSRHKVVWKKLDTHNPHLSVLDYKKKERVKEVDALSQKIDLLELKLKDAQDDDLFFTLNADAYYTDERWGVPKPQSFMNVKSYKEKLVDPFVLKLKDVIKNVVTEYLEVRSTCRSLRSELIGLKKEVEVSRVVFKKVKDDDKKLYKKGKDFDMVRSVLGEDEINRVIDSALEISFIRKKKYVGKER
jgi:hypothetical protein